MVLLLLARILKKSFGHFHFSPAGPLAELRFRTAKASRSCNFVLATFTSLLLSRYLSMPLARFSKAILRLRLSSITTQWSCSSPADASFAEARESAKCCRGTAELLPWLLDIQGHTTRFAQSPASQRLSPDFPTIVFCLQQGDSAFLLCRRAGRCCCLSYLRASRRTSGRHQSFLALEIFPPHQCPL